MIKIGVRTTTAMQKTRMGRAQHDPTRVLLRAHATDKRLENIAHQSAFFWSLYYNQDIFEMHTGPERVGNNVNNGNPTAWGCHSLFGKTCPLDTYCCT